MISTALVLAGFLTVGFYILYKKLPGWLQRWLARRYLLLDVFLCWAVFSALGFAIVGVMTAAMVSVFVSAWLYFAGKTKHLGKGGSS